MKGTVAKASQNWGRVSPGLRRLASASVAACWIAAATPAIGETKLTEFNGEWRGAGHDRDFPLQAPQPAICQTSVRATPQRMHSEMTCARQSGVQKLVRMTVLLQGDEITGRITQRMRQPGQEDAVINGVVSGQRVANTANLLVRWVGPTPNTMVELRLLNPTSYSLRVTALGITMMDVIFERPSARLPALR